MGGPISWSTDPNQNDVADPDIFLVEGQPPPTLNNAMRGMMAGVAKFVSDSVGANAATGGAGNTLSVSTAQVVDLTDAFELSFTTDATNAGPLGLSADGTGARPLQRPGNVALAPGDLVSGVVYQARYLPSLGRYILVSPIPEAPGRLSVFATESAVPPGWVICDGRLLSRSTYAALYAVLASVYGSTDSSNFRVPDLRGRTAFGADAQGGSPANRLSGVGGVGGAVGNSGGVEAVTLTAAQMPKHKHTGSTGDGGARPATVTGDGGAVPARNTGNGGAHGHDANADPVPNHTHTGTATASTGHAHTYKTALTFNNTAGSGTTNGPYWSGEQDVPTSTANPTFDVTTSPAGGHTPSVSITGAPAHAHTIPAVDDHSHTIPSVPAHTHPMNLDEAGGDAAHPNMPPALVLVWAIKA